MRPSLEEELRFATTPTYSTGSFKHKVICLYRAILRKAQDKGVLFTEYNEDVSRELWLDLRKAQENE